MASLSGGVREYQSALRDHWTNSNWHGFTFEWLPFNFVTVCYFILAGMGIGCVVLFVGALLYVEQNRRTKGWRGEKLQFLWWWILPPLSFFVLVYSHPIQTGHSLIYLPVLFMLLPAAAKRLAGSRHKYLLLTLVGFNLVTFLILETPVSVNRIREYESNVRNTVKLIRENCSPGNTILLNFDFMFVGFRDFMFHLPEYCSYQPRIYTLNGRPLLFAGFERRTYQVDSISLGPDVKYFVLYADEVLRDPTYLQGVQLDQFPNGQFLTTSTGLRFFRANVKDLHSLSPQDYPETFMTLVRRDNLPLLTRLVFPSIKDVLFLAFLFVPLMTKESGVLHDGDTGWHIRNGEHILATWEFPRSGLFLLYTPGCPLVRLGMAGRCGDGNHPSTWPA